MAYAIIRTKLFTRWLDGLRNQRAKLAIAARITRVGAGNMGDVKALGGGLSELRIDYAAGCRVYFTVRSGAVILLLAGGDKASQARDIEKACKMLADER